MARNFKIQLKWSAYFLRCALKLSASHHLAFLTSQIATLPQTYICLPDKLADTACEHLELLNFPHLNVCVYPVTAVSFTHCLLLLA
jgi:hypothetical protein